VSQYSSFKLSMFRVLLASIVAVCPATGSIASAQDTEFAMQAETAAQTQIAAQAETSTQSETATHTETPTQSEIATQAETSTQFGTATQILTKHAPLTALATGNGFGFAVVEPTTGVLTSLYAHPYMFSKPDPKNDLGEGIETSNFVKQMSWRSRDGAAAKVQNVDYVEQSQVITVKTDKNEQSFYMPFGIEQNVLITSCKSTAHNAQDLNIHWRHKIKSDIHYRMASGDAEVLTFTDIDEAVMLFPLGGGTRRRAPIIKDGLEMTLTGHGGWAIISLEKPNEANSRLAQFRMWRYGLNAASLEKRELSQLESWRVRPQIHFVSEAERKLWRQSEVVLRMAQCREPNDSDRHGHGLILASLPSGAWFVPWVRDMAYATIALIQMGHKQEARWAVEAYFNAQPVGRLIKDVHFPYQISLVRYFGNGAEEPFFTMEGSTNVEFDDWGLALWVFGKYVDQFHDYSLLDEKTYRGTIFDSACHFIVKPLLGNLETFKDGLIVSEDTSMWEERQKDKKHFAFSTAAAINGLRWFQKIAEHREDAAFKQDLDEKVKRLQIGFNEAYVTDAGLRGTLEPGIKNEVDGATLCAINFGVVNDPKVIEHTIESLAKLKMPSGGYRRVHSIVEDQAIYEYWYERQEFLFVNFCLAQIYTQTGQPAKAAQILAHMVTKAAADHNFVPEMYVSEINYRFKGQIGDPTGAVPMVGYGAGVLISYLLNRENAHFDR